MEIITYPTRKRGRGLATGRRRVRVRRPAMRRTKTFKRSIIDMGIELKFYDTSLISKALVTNSDGTAGEANPSATIALNTIVQGDGGSNRDGRNCIVKALHLKGIINVPAQANVTSLDQSPAIFIAIVLDHQTNGALLASENVYINPGASTITGCSLQRNLDFVKRFKVLKTIKMLIPQMQPSWDGTNIEVTGAMIPFEMHLPSLNIKTNYSATTESIANITDNSLNVIAWTTSTTYAPTLSYNCRVRFVG